MAIIFFNIGWMKKYQGVNTNDQVEGGFAYLLQNGTGHEQYNFLPYGGNVYGYVPVGWNKDTDDYNKLGIDKLGAGNDDESLDNITVVFISKNPTIKKTYVIGWYNDATVYRQPQKLKIKNRKLDGIYLFYVCQTKAENAYCVPESKRVFVIPSAHKESGGYGQSPIWYAGERQDIQDEVLDYISNGKMPHQIKKNTKKNLIAINQEDKKLVETNAVNATEYFYKELGYEVTTVESENLGWDLTVKNDIDEFYVEVKGTQGETVNFQLTPNEYKKLKKYWKKYKIAVATNCLSDIKLDVFSIAKYKDNKYKGHNDEGDILSLNEKREVYATGSVEKID